MNCSGIGACLVVDKGKRALPLLPSAVESGHRAFSEELRKVLLEAESGSLFKPSLPAYQDSKRAENIAFIF